MARVEVELGNENQDTVHRFLHYVYAGEVLYACGGGNPDEKALDGGPFPNADDPVAVASLAALLGCASRLGVARRAAMCSVETSASARGSRIWSRRGGGAPERGPRIAAGREPPRRLRTRALRLRGS